MEVHSLQTNLGQFWGFELQKLPAETREDSEDIPAVLNTVSQEASGAALQARRAKNAKLDRMLP